MTIKDFLDKNSIPYRVEKRSTSGTQFILEECPGCGEPGCFAIGENGLYNCLRLNNCGISGGFEKFQQFYGKTNHTLDKLNNNSFVNKTTEKEFRIPKIPMMKLSNANYNYLINKRKISKDTIDKSRMFNGVRGEICFPYYKNGKLVNVKHFIPATDTEKKKVWAEKDCRLCLFGQDNISEFDYLIICEGEIDQLSITEYGLKNVVSVPGGAGNLKWIESDWDFLDKFKEIYLCMDVDSAGQQHIRKMVSRLGNWRVKNILLPRKDANECLKDGIISEEILKCFENAEEFGPVELKTAGDFCVDVLDMFRNPKKYEGFRTGFDGLDKVIKGWRRGEVTIWSGQNGAGKTTILNQSCLYMGKNNINVCVASLELKPSRYLKWAIEQKVGTCYPREDDIISTFDWFSQWFYVVDIHDDVSVDKILNIFEYTAKRFGVEMFVIDSLMKIDLDANGDKAEQMSQKKFINKLTQFVKKFQVHIHLVAHPRKTEKDTDIPTKSDILGSGSITDLVDNVIIIWRVPDSKKIKENNADAMLFVRKNREYGILAGIPLYFEISSRRYSCCN